MNTEIVNEKKKRGRRPKNESSMPIENKAQNRFVIDLSKDEKERELVLATLKEVNNKTYGREINLKDIVLILLSKFTTKDIEKLKEASLTEMEKVKRLFEEHNNKNGTKLELGEFLVRKLNIN